MVTFVTHGSYAAMQYFCPFLIHPAQKAKQPAQGRLLLC